MRLSHKWEDIFNFYGLATTPATFPKGSDAEATASAKDTLKTGNQILISDVPLHETEKISGFVQCDKDLTLTIWQGNTPDLYSVSDVVTVAASALSSSHFVDGGGVKIGPFDVRGSLVKVTCNNAGAATKNFCCQIRARA